MRRGPGIYRTPWNRHGILLKPTAKQNAAMLGYSTREEMIVGGNNEEIAFLRFSENNVNTVRIRDERWSNWLFLAVAV